MNVSLTQKMASIGAPDIGKLCEKYGVINELSMDNMLLLINGQTTETEYSERFVKAFCSVRR